MGQLDRTAYYAGNPTTSSKKMGLFKHGIGNKISFDDLY